MAPAPDPGAPSAPEAVDDSSQLTSPSESALPEETQSTRLMLTTAAHFVQQHLHDQLADLGLTPRGLSVLSAIADLSRATVAEVAQQCLLSESAAERTLDELAESDLVDADAGLYGMTYSGSAAFAAARDLEDALFAEKSTTLRLELSTLITRLRDGGSDN